MPRRTVCWLSSARYSDPLDATEAGKWALLAGALDRELLVIGFARDLRPRRFHQSARFYLIPQPPVSLLRYIVFFALTPWLLLYLIWRHDISALVAQSPFEGAVAAWVKGCCRMFGKSIWLITENHNNFEEDLFLQRSIPLQSLYRRLMLGSARYAFRHSDALRVISTSTSERSRHYAPQLPQVRFMAYSDAGTFANHEREIAVGAAVDLVYAGVLIPRKGLHLLLEAFARLDHPRARLHLVGGAENAAYARRLRDQARELEIADRLHFVGAVSQPELAAYFGRARALVLPSLSEGLGRVVVEAMLVGAPVIGCRVGGIPDLIDDGVNGLLIPPNDVAALAAALERIYAADVAAMGDQARSFATDFFSPQKYADGYRQLFAMADGADADQPRD